jgi:hypothetical protein
MGNKIMMEMGMYTAKTVGTVRYAAYFDKLIWNWMARTVNAKRKA